MHTVRGSISLHTARGASEALAIASPKVQSVPQDEPHREEPTSAQALVDEEEEQGLGEWAAEEENEEHEEDEQVPATEASGPEGSNDRVIADSDEEFPVLLASDGEEDDERSEQRLGSSHTHTHTLTHTPIPPKNNICPPSLTPFPRIIAFTADASTKGEAGCRPAGC